MSLPGHLHSIPDGTMCDNHPDLLATKRVQGETDSFGCEMHDFCAECYAEYKREVEESDTSGYCDFCKSFANKLRNRRDYEEGLNGPVYQVCESCNSKANKRELDQLDEYGEY